MSDAGSKVGEARTLATGHQVMANYLTKGADVEFHNSRARILRELADEIERLSERAATVDELRSALKRMVEMYSAIMRKTKLARWVSDLDLLHELHDASIQTERALARADAGRAGSMAKIEDGGPAFPAIEQVYDDEGGYSLHYHEGMTLREHAAIKLRVPNSGTEWLDEMIREARRLDLAGQALAGPTANMEHEEFYAMSCPHMASLAYRYADAMLRARTTDGDAPP